MYTQEELDRLSDAYEAAATHARATANNGKADNLTRSCAWKAAGFAALDMAYARQHHADPSDHNGTHAKAMTESAYRLAETCFRRAANCMAMHMGSAKHPNASRLAAFAQMARHAHTGIA